MNKTMRVITMAGLGLLAGVTISAGSAQAVGSTAQPGAKASGGQASQTLPHGGRDGVAGHYRSLGDCEVAGRTGVVFGDWDFFDCDLLSFGFRRGIWELTVDREGRGHGFGHGNGHVKPVKPIKPVKPVKPVKPHEPKGDDGYGR